jgi:hypothetical protein
MDSMPASFQPQFLNPAIRKEQINIRPTLGWCLGRGIERAASLEYVWQWGDNGGFKNFVAAEPRMVNKLIGRWG